MIIRRSRQDLIQIKDYKDDLDKNNMAFSKVKEPELLEYDLGNIKNLYLKTLKRISPDIENDETIAENITCYKAARYNATSYIKPEYLKQIARTLEENEIENINLFTEGQKNISKFMRRLLVQRFESSQAAFKVTLNRMIENSVNILNWIDKREKVPIFKRGNLPDINSFYNNEDTSDTLFGEEIGNILFEEEITKNRYESLVEIPIEYISDDFVKDIKSDIAVLKEIQEEWFSESLSEPLGDPKSENFIKIIKAQLQNDSKRKIVVFSSFADTVEDIAQKLENENVRVIQHTSKSPKGNREEIKQNFDASSKTQKNDFDVLVATDSISEGCNLHRAGTIFNYDIPYNPTRVIQRVGRINRINKKMFESLYIYNYFPTSVGESQTHTKEITTLKMAMMNAILGEDTKVLTGDIELKSFFAEQYKALVAEEEKENPLTKYKKILESAKGTPEYNLAKSIPHRARIARNTESKQKGILVFGKKGNLCVFKMKKQFSLQDESVLKDKKTSNDVVTLGAEDAFALLDATKDEKSCALSKDFDKDYENIKKDLFVPQEVNTIATEIDKSTRATLDKIEAIKGANILDETYLDLLEKAVRLYSLSDYSLKKIKNLPLEEIENLKDIITTEYLRRIVGLENIGETTPNALILSEEIN